jgi:very-short-patch-repair endonuclease
MRGQTSHFILNQRIQRTLRKNLTNAEQKLWQRLRGCQVGGFKFRRQHPFENFVLDFVCLDRKLVIEVDGSQHLDSMDDQKRDALLACAGFRVLRFWNDQVLNETDAVLEKIWDTLSE